jgi:hypothetical protein
MIFQKIRTCSCDFKKIVAKRLAIGYVLFSEDADKERFNYSNLEK